MVIVRDTKTTPASQQEDGEHEEHDRHDPVSETC